MAVNCSGPVAGGSGTIELALVWPLALRKPMVPVQEEALVPEAGQASENQADGGCRTAPAAAEPTPPKRMR